MDSIVVKAPFMSAEEDLVFPPNTVVQFVIDQTIFTISVENNTPVIAAHDQLSDLPRYLNWNVYKLYVRKEMDEKREPLGYEKWSATQRMHNAIISKPTSGQRILGGEFTYENGKLDFRCHTQNVEFPEVLQAITALRDECDRQIANKEKCPFHVATDAPAIPPQFMFSHDKLQGRNGARTVELVVLGGKYSYVETQSRKMIDDGEWYAYMETDKKKLKHLFPHASIYAMTDSRLSNKHKERIKKLESEIGTFKNQK